MKTRDVKFSKSLNLNHFKTLNNTMKTNDSSTQSEIEKMPDVKLQTVSERRNVREIIVHCTATRRGREVSVAEIDRWHRERGFAGIGYHYVVHADGKVEPGRSEGLAGAHCRGHNAFSVGVVYVGGLNARGTPEDTRTPAQRESLQRLVRMLKERYPGAAVHGHREFAAKACPCFDAAKEYAGL